MKNMKSFEACIEIVLTFCIWYYFVILTTGRIFLF
jgi:hypothetical protein